MMFEAMTFKVCPIHIKHQTSNSKKRCLYTTALFLYFKFKQILNFLKINKYWQGAIDLVFLLRIESDKIRDDLVIVIILENVL